MKNTFLILVMVFMVGMCSAVQPPRKPFIQIKIDDKSYKNGDILTVTPGQKMLIAVEMEGGRRDYCKFPETYSDITGTAQILSRSKDGLVYQIKDKKAEWKLLSEDAKFTTDEYIRVNAVENKPSAELTVTSEVFSQSYLKIVLKTSWQFSQNEQTSQEDNLAESTIYFKTAGSSDVWFRSENIQASGIKNEQVLDKLNAAKAECDSIENNIYKLKFSAVQLSIRDLQSAVNTLKSTIDEVIAGNPSYKVKVSFIGVPTDDPFKDIEALSVIKNKWDSLSVLVTTLKQELVKFASKPKQENKDELIKIITTYNSWQNKLSENTFTILSRYLPEVNIENVKMPDKFILIAGDKAVPDYSTTLTDFHTFIDTRSIQVPDELQNINSVRTRIQAVRLYDGMLRSYFSSINWAEWKSTRGF
jgi:hypothetical protein